MIIYDEGTYIEDSVWNDIKRESKEQNKMLSDYYGDKDVEVYV